MTISLPPPSRRHQPEQWLGELTGRPNGAGELIQEAEAELANEARLSGVMDHACQLMMEAKYDGATHMVYLLRWGGLCAMHGVCGGTSHRPLRHYGRCADALLHRPRGGP